MSPAELELAYRAAMRALPDFRFGHEQLVRLLGALPPPPPGTPVAARHEHLQRIIQEIRALNPCNPLDAMSVMQIIASRHAAMHSARRSFDPTLPARLVAGLRRSAENLLRGARQMERQLKKEQAGRNASGQAPAEVKFDLEALDAIWCGTAPRAPVPTVVQTGLKSGGHAVVGQPPPAAPAPAERVKFTLCGQRTDLVRLATIPAAGSA